jgi:hypothetical protein
MTRYIYISLFVSVVSLYSQDVSQIVTLNRKTDGYRGIWYMNQPSNDEYVYKYSGGLGTYCAKHRPFAVYAEPVAKTFFCYGGTTSDSNRELLHMVSYFDHETKMVPRPTVLLNKATDDAHDNPVMTMDSQGYIWIFSTSHGTSRPSFIHRSARPYNIDKFERINAGMAGPGGTVTIDNFSYMQVWYSGARGFLAFLTRYNAPVKRTSFFMQSSDGKNWTPEVRLAAIEWGHYQVSAAGSEKAGCAFNFHPEGKGLNWRTNLYYIETGDGKQWQTADGTPLTLPLQTRRNPALVHDYLADSLNVYLKDITYDDHDRPVLLYVTSKGYKSGPENDPRVWTTARWDGVAWQINQAFRSDNNYDMGSLYIEDDLWRIIAPTETGPQPWNPGGEVAYWQSRNKGESWHKIKQMTSGSARNHTYVRRPVNAHPDFYALWADGHGRKPSQSNLYYSDRSGDVYVLPRHMEADFSKPVRITHEVKP